MRNKKQQLMVRVLVLLLPAYTVAYLTGAMIYTMPMLAACTLIAANLFGEDEVENRVDEDGSPEGESVNAEMAMMVDEDGGGGLDG